MPAFLSDAWIAEFDRAARAASSLCAIGAGRRLVVEQRVEQPSRVVVYHLEFDTGGARVRPGPADKPDLVLIMDETTARALRRGDLNAQQAASSGQLKIRGRPEHLRPAVEALRSVGDVFRSVRDETTDAEAGAGASVPAARLDGTVDDTG